MYAVCSSNTYLGSYCTVTLGQRYGNVLYTLYILNIVYIHTYVPSSSSHISRSQAIPLPHPPSVLIRSRVIKCINLSKIYANDLGTFSYSPNIKVLPYA